MPLLTHFPHEMDEMGAHEDEPLHQSTDEDEEMKERKEEEPPRVTNQQQPQPPPRFGQTTTFSTMQAEMRDALVFRTLRPFYIHQWLDILDTQQTWLECQVIDIDPIESAYTACSANTVSTSVAGWKPMIAPPANSPPSSSSSSSSPGPPRYQPPPQQRIRVHYKGFKSKYDEWLDVSSDQTSDMRHRIALLHTHTHALHPTKNRRPALVGEQCDVLDTLGTWYSGRIIDWDLERRMRKVHYDNCSDKFDEWLNVDSYRLQPPGEYKSQPIQPVKPRGVGGGRVMVPPSHSAAVTAEKLQAFQATVDNEIRFRRLLDEHLGYEIVDQKEDGNCLFRSVSHQVYGDPSWHNIVRQNCMNYIEKEQYFFQHFIAGETFQEYVARMRNDGEWGDNVEIQAISEIYDRPIEIYAYSYKPLKTFTSSSGTATTTPPIRLSYHFASHYNSIIDRRNHHLTCTTLEPGVIEAAALARVTALRQAMLAQQSQPQSSSSVSASSSSPEIPASLMAARQIFSSSQSRLAANPLDFENAVAASLQDMSAQDAALLAQAEQQSLREHEEELMIEATVKASQQEAAAAAAAGTSTSSSTTSTSTPAKPANLEDETLRKALAASLQGVVQQDNEDELQRVLRESAATAPAMAAAAASTPMDEDLQRVLQSSLLDRDDAIPNAVKQCVAFGFPLEQCVQAWALIGEMAAMTGVAEEVVVQRMMDYLLGQ